MLPTTLFVPRGGLTFGHKVNTKHTTRQFQRKLPQTSIQFDAKFTNFNFLRSINTVGWCAKEKGAKLELIDIELPDLQANEVEIDMTHCGLCHTDYSMVHNLWGVSTYPMVPGHEGVGVIRTLGKGLSSQSNLKVGDIVGIGWIRDSCGTCNPCMEGKENHCQEGYQGTYLGKASMFGCFSKVMHVNSRFVFKVPQNVKPEEAAPFFCAGITVFEPICDYVKTGDRVGVVALGGLGHMAIKFLKSMSVEVTLLSHSEGKREKAKKLGVDHYVNYNDPSSLQSTKGKLDVIIDTCPYPVDVASVILPCLRMNSTYCKVGIPKGGEAMNIPYIPLVFNAFKIVGSIVSGSKNTKRMLRCCEFAGLKSDVEVVPFSQVNEAMQRVKSDTVSESRIVLKW